MSTGPPEPLVFGGDYQQARPHIQRSTLGKEEAEQAYELLRTTLGNAHDLTEARVRALVRSATVERVSKYATIAEEGMPATTLCWVLDGECVTTSFGSEGRMPPAAAASRGVGPGSLPLERLGPGAYFGEGVLLNAVYVRSVRTSSSRCTVLRWDAAQLKAAGIVPDILKQSLVFRLARDIPKLTAFQAISKLVPMLPYLHVEHFPLNAGLFKLGDAPDKLYIVASGEVELYKEVEVQGTTKRVVIMHISDRSERPWFGELSLWLGTTRALSARVTEPFTALTVHRRDFSAFLLSSPDLRSMFSTLVGAFHKLDQIKAEKERHEQSNARRNQRPVNGSSGTALPDDRAKPKGAPDANQCLSPGKKGDSGGETEAAPSADQDHRPATVAEWMKALYARPAGDEQWIGAMVKGGVGTARPGAVGPARP